MEVISVAEEAVFRAQDGAVLIYTVEHLVSSLAGLGIDAITIEIDGDEVLALTAVRLICQSLKAAGLVELEAERVYFEIKDRICVARNGASVMITRRKISRFVIAGVFRTPCSGSRHLHAHA